MATSCRCDQLRLGSRPNRPPTTVAKTPPTVGYGLRGRCLLDQDADSGIYPFPVTALRGSSTRCESAAKQTPVIAVVGRAIQDGPPDDRLICSCVFDIEIAKGLACDHGGVEVGRQEAAVDKESLERARNRRRHSCRPGGRGTPQRGHLGTGASTRPSEPGSATDRQCSWRGRRSPRPAQGGKSRPGTGPRWRRRRFGRTRVGRYGSSAPALETFS